MTPHELRRLGFQALALLVVALIPILSGDAYLAQVGATASVYVVAVIGFNLVLGEAGLLSMGHATFMGAGAYIYALLADSVPTLLAAGLAIAGVALLAALVGIVTLRFEEVYFAIATLAVAEIVRNVVSHVDFTGGVNGIVVPELRIGGAGLAGASDAYALGVGAMVVALVSHAFISSSPLGRRFRAIRDDEISAPAMGIPLFRTRMVAFVLGAVFAAVAGVVFAISLRFIDPSILSVDVSILLIAMLVVGGMGSVWGAIFGALALALAPQFLRFLESASELFVGVIIVLAILSGRAGIAGLGRQLRSVVSRGTKEHESVPGIGTFSVEHVRVEEPVALELDGVAKRFGGLQALADVTAVFEPGRINGLIGPNGSGKSTTLNVITGIHPPDEGRVLLGKADISREAPHRVAMAGIGRTFQGVRLFADLNVRDNVMPMVEGTGLRRAAARQRVEELLAAVGLAGLGELPVESLPHGHRRLLEVARALAIRPRVLLLDEPTAGLSSSESEQLSDLLKGLAAGGLNVVVIEHNMPFMLGLASHLVVLDQGTVIASGAPADVVANRAVRSAYLGEDGPTELPTMSEAPRSGP